MERVAGKIMLSWGARRWAIAFGAGALAVLSQPPFDFFAVLFLSFPVLVWLLDGASGEPGAGFLRRLMPAFGIGWWFGFGYFVAGLWWLANALLAEGNDFAWAVPLAVFGLPALLSFFYGFATLLARLLWSDGAGRIAALAFSFGLAEWLRGFLFTGFPWNAIGYGAMPVPLMMQIDGLIGLSAMTTLTIFVVSVPALIGTRTEMRLAAALAVALVAGQTGYGLWALSRHDTPAKDSALIRIVQPSIVQSAKWDQAEADRIFRRLLDLSGMPASDSQPAPDIIVWPETAIPFLLTENAGALKQIGDMLGDGQILITGAVREENSAVSIRYYNSILVIGDTGEIVAAADKRHLVPFGEYLPFRDVLEGLGLSAIAALPGEFTAGSRLETVPVSDRLHFLPLICYEAIFPGEMTAAGPPADFMVNVTNDAWYGDTPGPPQHFRQAQLRSVETGLPLIRSANNGISAVVDSSGKVLAGLSHNVIGAIDVQLPGSLPVITGRNAKNVLFLLISLVFLAVALVSRRKDDRKVRLTDKP